MSLLEPELPSGLIYVANWLTHQEHEEAVATVDQSPFDTSLQRRVQHYGARYDYGSSSISELGSAPEIPKVLNIIGERLFKEGYFSRVPEQVIVNEYLTDQGISAHIDQLSFGGAVATVSLLESWPMLFRRTDGTAKVEVFLEVRSLALMTGEARYEWTHEIVKRKVDVEGGLKRMRKRRLSLTFRTIGDG
jgi:alkylated DNA repair dioxygenase AlkB